MAFNEFSLLLQDVVLSAPDGTQNLARRLGKKQAKLLREVNPRDRRAKLGADTLLRLMEVSRDVRPLEYMARQLGMQLAPPAEKKDSGQ